MNHFELGISESRSANSTHPYDRWLANAQNILGHDLDGTECIDGYSLDGAYEAFRAGAHSADYAARVQSARRGMGVSILTDIMRDIY